MKAAHVNVKVEQSSTLTFNRDLPYVAAILFTRVKFTCVYARKNYATVEIYPNFTAIFTNMWIVKFKSQLTIAFFAAVNILMDLSGNKTLTVSKVHGLWFVIGGFRSVSRVSVFQGSLLVIVIMIDGSEKCNFEGGLEFNALSIHEILIHLLLLDWKDETIQAVLWYNWHGSSCWLWYCSSSSWCSWSHCNDETFDWKQQSVTCFLILLLFI